MNCKTIACITMLLSLAATTARGALVLYEGFDYSGTGALTGAAGGIGMWTGAWVADGTSMTLTASGLSHASLPSAGVAVADTSASGARGSYRSWDTTGYADHGSELWFSFLAVTLTGGATGGAEFRVHPLGGTVNSQGSGVYMWGNNTLSIRIEGSNLPDTDRIGFPRGQTNLVVGRINFSDVSGQDSMRVWVNPDLGAPPDDADGVGWTGNFNHISQVYMRGGSTWLGEFDEFRMATTFLDAVTNPLSWAPAAGAGGSGTWDAMSDSWALQWDGSGTKQAWPAAGTNNDAAFGGAGGDVTIAAGGVTANDLLFIAGDYTLGGGKLTLVGEGPAIFVAPSVEATIDSVIGGSQGLTKSGAGTLVLSAANEHSGGTTVLGGTLRLDGNDRLPAGGALNIRGGTLDLGGNNQTAGSLAGAGNVSLGNGTLNVGGNGASTTFSGDISGAGGNLIKVGSGTLTLSGDNQHGNTTIDEGILVIASTAALPGWNQDDRYTVAAGATLAVGNGVSQAEVNDMLGTNGFQAGARIGFDTSAGNREHTSGIGGDIGLVKLGSNTLTLSAATAYTGGTTVLDGTLLLAGDDRLPTGGTITAAGGTLDLGGFSQTTSGAVTFAGGTVSNGTLVNTGTHYDGQSGTVSANLDGAVGLTKTGSGTLLLSGTNTYTGGTVVSQGVLTLASVAALPGGYSVADAATLALANSVPDADFATILAAGAFAPGGRIGFDTSAGDRTYAGALTGNLNLAKVGANILTLTNSPEHTGTTTIAGGILRFDTRADTHLAGGLAGAGTLQKINTGTLTLSGPNSHTGGIVVDNGQIIADFTATNPLGSGTVTMRGGALTFRNASAASVGRLDNVNETRNEIRVENGATITTSRLQGQGIAPWLIDLTGGGTFVATATTGMAMREGVLMGGDRANVYVKDDNGVGFATLNSSTRVISRYTGATQLDETNSGNTSNFFSNSSITRTADLDFQTLAIDTSAGPVTLAMGDNTIGSTSRGLGILFTGDHDAVISSTRNFDGWAVFTANYSSGTATIDMGLDDIAIVSTGPGLVVATTDVGLRQLLLADGVVRLTGEWDLAMSSGSRLWGGSIVEVGANMFAADDGIDFGLDLGGGNGQIALRGSAGFSAHGQARVVSLGGATPTPLTWGTTNFLRSGNGDNSYALRFGSPWSDATLVFANPIDLNGRERVIDVADGVYSDNVDARLTGIISGAGPLASLVKTGAGTLALDADNTYEGRTTILDGTLLVNGSLSGISGVTVHAGATLGGSGTIAGTNTILHGGFLAPGESVGTLTFLDDLDISGVGPGALRFELGGLDHYDQIVVGGTLTIDELAWDHFAFTPLDGFGVGVYTLFDGTIEGGLGANIYGTIGGFQAYLELGSLQLVVIPEPGAWLLLAMGGLVLLMVRRRRR